MEPAVRSPRIESAIIADRARNGAFGPPQDSQSSRAANGYWPSEPCRGERNFWMQRREAKIGLRDRKFHRRPKERNDTGENPHRNGLSGVGVGICGLEGLDGGDGMVRTSCPHAVLSNRVSATRLDRCDLALAPRGVRSVPRPERAPSAAA